MSGPCTAVLDVFLLEGLHVLGTFYPLCVFLTPLSACHAEAMGPTYGYAGRGVDIPQLIAHAKQGVAAEAQCQGTARHLGSPLLCRQPRCFQDDDGYSGGYSAHAWRMKMCLFSCHCA